jgi:hypothetical protein
MCVETPITVQDIMSELIINNAIIMYASVSAMYVQSLWMVASYVTVLEA